MRASSRPTGETPKDEDEPDVLIPEGVAWTSTEDRRMVEALRRRARVISQLKLQRSRVSVGDYVSDEVTKFRGERFRIERQIVAMRKDLEEDDAGQVQEADALKNHRRRGVPPRRNHARDRGGAGRLLRRYDEELWIAPSSSLNPILSVVCTSTV